MISITKKNTAGAYAEALNVMASPEVVAAKKIIAAYHKGWKDATKPSLDVRDGRIVLRADRIKTRGLQFTRGDDGDSMIMTYRGLSSTAKWRSPDSKPRVGSIVLSNIKRV